jgi:hypothetical protein
LTSGGVPSVDVSNVLSEEKKQQVVALGRLGWSLRKIQKTTGVRRETAADYLRSAGIGLRPPGAWGRRAPAKPANEVIPGPEAAKPASQGDEVTPGFGAEPAAKPVAAPESQPGRRPSVSVCEPTVKPSSWASRRVVTPRGSGRTWWVSTASPATIRASNASSAAFAARSPRKPAR